jgi:hypothetical protein
MRCSSITIIISLQTLINLVFTFFYYYNQGENDLTYWFLFRGFKDFPKNNNNNNNNRRIIRGSRILEI